MNMHHMNVNGAFLFEKITESLATNLHHFGKAALKDLYEIVETVNVCSTEI